MTHPKLLGAIGVALALASFLAAGPVASSPAFGFTPLPKHVIECSTMQSEAASVSAPILLSGCRRPRTTAGSGLSSALGPGPYPITWSTGKETNFSSRSIAFPAPSRCPAPQFEFDFVGTVATVQGPWTKQFLGEAVTFDVCLTNQFVTVGLVSGTMFEIGTLSS